MPHRLSGLLAASLLATFLLVSPSHAQPTDTSFVALPAGTALGLGALIHTDGYVGRDETSDGFNVATARLRLRGAAHRARFFVQADLTRNPTLLDARVRLPVSSEVSVTAGRFKAPFSRETLTSSMRLPFLDRARAMDALAPSRQIGVSLRAALVPERLRLEAGLFNGNGGTAWRNDNDALLYTGRLVGTVPLPGGSLQLGANAGYSEDAAVTLAPVVSSFSGRRALYGADALLRWRPWLLATEWVAASLDPAADSSYRPSGYHVTAGYRFTATHQLLLRLDAFDPGLNGSGANEQLVLGYNLFWTTALKLQANYTAPLDALDEGFAGFRLQLGLD